MTHFRIVHSDGRARSGVLQTTHGTVHTPAFMPVATQGVIRRLPFEMLQAADIDMFMANTYHLELRPGSQTIATLGGLHHFTSRNKPWITDSGGFQVYSLAKLNKVTDDGVVFKNHIDGREMFLGPRESMAIQNSLGADIIMAFDECPAADLPHEAVLESLERTHRWEEASLRHHQRDDQLLYGIVQGGVFDDLRAKSRDFLANLPFQGYAMGGLAVGEGHAKMMQVLTNTTLPEDSPRYLMGVGWPRDIFEAVDLGYDQFDCVLPSRNGRNGTAFVPTGKANIKRKENAKSDLAIQEGCPCPTCLRYSRGLLHHLLHVEEVLGGALISLHNLYFYENMMQQIRDAVAAKTFGQLKHEFLSQFYESTDSV